MRAIYGEDEITWRVHAICASYGVVRSKDTVSFRLNSHIVLERTKISRVKNRDVIRI
jgi:hypothetical protein